MVLPPSRKEPEDHITFAVIARLSGEHDPNNNHPQEIIQIMRELFDIYIGPTFITYQEPNYVIFVDDPLTQMRMLSMPVINAGGSYIEMVPWSKEHEWAQIPWITGHSPQILIDPLTILPVTPSSLARTGMAATIPPGYDLKSPDYSYLLIAELKELYRSKFDAINECIIISKEMISMREEICIRIEELACFSCNCTKRNGNSEFIGDVIQNLLTTSTRTQVLNNFPDGVGGKQKIPLQLDGFTDAAMSSEVGLPETYTSRLKIIYNAAVQKVFKTEPIIETIKKENDRFQTYITIGEWTHIFVGGSKKSAMAQEAAAMCYSLKHITHIIGYSVIDLNYPTLKTLIEHMDTWSAEMNVLHFRAAYALAETKEMHECLAELNMLHGTTCNCLVNATEKIVSMSNNHLSKLIQKARRFMKLKAQYHSTWKKSGSLLLRHAHWHPSGRPSIASASNA